MKFLYSSISRIVRFYYDGFRDLSWWGRRAWLIIIIKLFIIFAVLKVFFLPDFLAKRFNSDDEKSRYVIEELLNSPGHHDR